MIGSCASSVSWSAHMGTFHFRACSIPRIWSTLANRRRLGDEEEKQNVEKEKNVVTRSFRISSFWVIVILCVSQGEGEAVMILSVCININ